MSDLTGTALLRIYQEKTLFCLFRAERNHLMGQRNNPLRSMFQGLAGGVFLIGLAIAFWVSSFSGGMFLPILFWALAFSALFGSISSLNPRHMYGAVSGFVFMAGLGILFLPGISFWPGILILLGITAILGAIARPLFMGLFGAGVLGAATMINRQPPNYQPPQETSYQPYQQGYQQQEETYREGGQSYQYQPSQPQPKYDQAQYEEPATQYPQELPPMQQ
jgi:hypothetical protein